MKTKLTDKIALAATVPAGKDEVWLADTLDKFGLRIRATSEGITKTWMLRYRDDAGRSVRYTIGTFPEMNTARARGIAIEKLPNIQHGVAPHQERVEKAKVAAAEQARALKTFASVAEEFLAHQKSELRPKSLGETTRYLTKHWACLARVPMHEITLELIASRLDEIARESKPTANKARAALHGMFTWAMTRGKVESNPVARFPKFEETSRERVLSMDELVAVWSACRDDDYGRIVRLLILTGQRRGEVGGLLWPEVDLEKALWTLPKERAKNGCSNTVPLVPAALALLPARTGQDNLFGQGAGGFRNWGEAKAALDQRAGVAAWTIHDLRRSCATHMGRLGVQPHIIEVLLNHRSAAQVGELALPGHRSTIAGVYNRAAYEVEVRQAALLWAEHITGAGVVVTLRRAG
jgi:integrase